MIVKHVLNDGELLLYAERSITRLYGGVRIWIRRRRRWRLQRRKRICEHFFLFYRFICHNMTRYTGVPMCRYVILIQLRVIIPAPYVTTTSSHCYWHTRVRNCRGFVSIKTHFAFTVLNVVEKYFVDIGTSDPPHADRL